MSGRKKPRITICPCHAKEVVLVYNIKKRKVHFIWLKDRDGRVIWDGSPFYLKGVHRFHNPERLIRMLIEARKYEATEEVCRQAMWEGGSIGKIWRRMPDGTVAESDDKSLPITFPPSGTKFVTAVEKWRPSWTREG